MSTELTNEQKCSFMTNAEYQKVVPILMNLATASLVVPAVFEKEFVAAPDQKAYVLALVTHWAFPGWILLVFSLFCGCVFHIASAKLVKALYGGYDSRDRVTLFETVLVKPWCWSKRDNQTWQECSYENLRDVSVGGLVLFFFLGLGCWALMVRHFKIV